VLSFGGTKNGMAVGEAVVFFDKDLAKEFDYRCKQAGQLASKMRFLTASWVGMLRDGAWLRHASHANAMAKRLATGLVKLPGIKLAHTCQTNGAFVQMPAPIIKALYERGWKFYTHVSPNDCRLMCSWDTTTEDVDAFIADVKALTGRKKP
jgi:threonine aldolase